MSNLSATVIRGATVYPAGLGNRILSPGSVLCLGDRIAAVGSDAVVDAVLNAQPNRVRESAETVDARGMMLLPGFVNAHWHDMFAARIPFKGALREPSDSGDEPGFFAHGGNVHQVSMAFDSFAGLIGGLTPDEALAIAR